MFMLSPGKAASATSLYEMEASHLHPVVREVLLKSWLPVVCRVRVDEPEPRGRVPDPDLIEIEARTHVGGHVTADAETEVHVGGSSGLGVVDGLEFEAGVVNGGLS